MEKRIVSLLLPYNHDFEVILQKRKGFINKQTDKDYGFFGGHLEEGETINQTLKREIMEELSLDTDKIKSLKFFKKYSNEVKEKNAFVERNLFLCKIEDVKNMQVHEGKEDTLNILDAINRNMSEIDKYILKEVYDYIMNEKNS